VFVYYKGDNSYLSARRRRRAPLFPANAAICSHIFRRMQPRRRRVSRAGAAAVRPAPSPPWWAARSPRLAVFGAPVASAAAAAAASSWALWLDPTCSGRGGGGRT
jgi:hypothetical protein